MWGWHGSPGLQQPGKGVLPTLWGRPQFHIHASPGPQVHVLPGRWVLQCHPPRPRSALPPFVSPTSALSPLQGAPTQLVHYLKDSSHRFPAWFYSELGGFYFLSGQPPSIRRILMPPSDSAYCSRPCLALSANTKVPPMAASCVHLALCGAEPGSHPGPCLSPEMLRAMRRDRQRALLCHS